MHKLLVLYPHPKNPESFTEYYERSHLPLAREIPLMIRSQYGLGMSGEDSPYFGVFEATFKSRDDFDFAMSSPAGLAVQADVRNYATGGAVVLNFPVNDLAHISQVDPIQASAGDEAGDHR